MPFVIWINIISAEQHNYTFPEHVISYFQPSLSVVSMSWQDDNLYLQHVDMTDYWDIIQYQSDTAV